jgi:hypothetical protein
MNSPRASSVGASSSNHKVYSAAWAAEGQEVSLLTDGLVEAESTLANAYARHDVPNFLLSGGCMDSKLTMVQNY